MSSQQSATRAVLKHEAVVDALYAGIVDGTYAPGSRFLTQEDVMARWGIAKATVQRVFRTLTRNGYLVPRGAAGTFVAEFPPHLYHMALTFPFYADQLPMSRFYMGIRAEAAHIAKSGPWRITPYYGLDDRQISPDLSQLQADIAAHRIGGVILAAPNFHLITHLAETTPNFPGVSIASDSSVLLPRMPVVYPDGEAWMQQALTQLAMRGRTRVALVTYTLLPGGEDRFIRQAADFGLAAAPYRIFSTYSNSACILRNVVHCLMRLPAEIRPDSLLIADDNLVEATVAGLHDAGVRVPEELDIVAACNYPHLPVSALPVCWLGTDTHELLQRCIALLTAYRQNEEYPLVTYLPPAFVTA